MELSFPGAKVPWYGSSWNFRSLELSPPGTKVPRTFAPTTFVHGYVRIRGCVPVLMFVLQTPYRQAYINIRQRPHNHHIQDTTLVSLTEILLPACSTKVVINFI